MSKLILSNATLEGSRHVSHHRSSSFDDDLDHSFVIFKNVEHRTELRRLHVRGT